MDYIHRGGSELGSGIGGLAGLGSTSSPNLNSNKLNGA